MPTESTTLWAIRFATADLYTVHCPVLLLLVTQFPIPASTEPTMHLIIRGAAACPCLRIAEPMPRKRRPMQQSSSALYQPPLGHPEPAVSITDRTATCGISAQIIRYRFMKLGPMLT